MSYLHTLPTDAQTTDIDHVQIDRKIIEEGLDIHTECAYGSTDTDGFVPHMAYAEGNTDTLVLPDADAFAEAAATYDYEETDMLGRLNEAIAKYADDNDLWHTQQ